MDIGDKLIMLENKEIQTRVNSILREANRKKKDKLNILTGTTHESYQTAMAWTQHNFYAIPGQHIKRWNPKFRPQPHNYVELSTQEIPNWLDIDLVLSQHKFGQYQVLAPIAKRLGCKLISLEHTLPQSWHIEHLDKFKQMSGDVNVFISEMNRDAWGYSEDEAVVIHHGIETDLFIPKDDIYKNPHIISVNNDFIGRGQILGFDIFQEVTNGLRTHLVGETANISKPAKDVFELISFYQQATLLLSVTRSSPIPTVVLESMSCGTPVIALNNCLLPYVIEHGINGFLGESAKELRTYCELLLNNPDMAKQMGEKARQTILDKFSLSSFVNNWNEVFYKAVN